jgi:hypothetical protein
MPWELVPRFPVDAVTSWLYLEEGLNMSYLLQRPIAETPPENARTWQAPKETAGLWVAEVPCLDDEWERLWTDIGGEG